MTFQMSYVREETVMVEVYLPGEHWEVEFFGDGNVEVEVFRSNGDILSESAVEEMFDRWNEA